MKQLVREYVYWPKMSQNIVNYRKNCPQRYYLICGHKQSNISKEFALITQGQLTPSICSFYTQQISNVVITRIICSNCITEIWKVFDRYLNFSVIRKYSLITITHRSFLTIVQWNRSNIFNISNQTPTVE